MLDKKSQINILVSINDISYKVAIDYESKYTSKIHGYLIKSNLQVILVSSNILKYNMITKY